MEQIVFDLEKRLGSFKPMNATNGGPRHRRHTAEMQIGNFDADPNWEEAYDFLCTDESILIPAGPGLQ